MSEPLSAIARELAALTASHLIRPSEHIYITSNYTDARKLLWCLQAKSDGTYARIFDHSRIGTGVATKLKDSVVQEALDFLRIDARLIKINEDKAKCRK